jgi:hypothetical protein
MNVNWKLVASDVTASLTMLSMIPYDKDTLDIINQVVPGSWIPWIIKAGIGATLILRLWDRYFPHQQNQTAVVPQTGAVQATITK